MAKLFSTAVFGAMALFSVMGVTPASALILQKTIVLQKEIEKAVTTDTALTAQLSLNCDAGVGKCTYETIASIQMGGNFASANQVGAYLSIDGGAPLCPLSGNVPNDGSIFERTTVLLNQAVTRGAHTVQLRLCSSAGGFHTEGYRATIRVYTPQ